MARIAAIVVTYNRKEKLLNCLEHVLSQQLRREEGRQPWTLDVFVIDNASTDGTRDALAPLIDSGFVRYFNTGENLGGAGGFNYGMRRAVEDGYDYLWVMDDDCYPQPGALQAFSDADERLAGHWGFLSSVVLWKDGSICTMNIQRHPLFTNITDFTPDLQPCTMASFVSLFVAADTVTRLGLPIADFFIWTDDWEFTRRISRTQSCYVVGKSIVVHDSDTNLPGNIITDPPSRLDRYRYIYRNDVVLYREEGLPGAAFVAARDIYHIAQVLISPSGGKLKKVNTIIKGTIDGLNFHPTIEYASAKKER